MERGKGPAARFGAKGRLIRRTSALSIELGHSAEHDLAHGIKFYERQEVGLGSYFLDSLIANIESLQVFAGVQEAIGSVLTIQHLVSTRKCAVASGLWPVASGMGRAVVRC